MTKKIYQKPQTDIFVFAENNYLMAGSVRNDDQKIFEGDPDPSKVDPGDQNTHPADSKKWSFDAWED